MVQVTRLSNVRAQKGEIETGAKCMSAGQPVLFILLQGRMISRSECHVELFLMIQNKCYSQPLDLILLLVATQLLWANNKCIKAFITKAM